MRVIPEGCQEVVELTRGQIFLLMASMFLGIMSKQPHEPTTSFGHLSDSPYQPSQTKKSLVSVGKSVLDSQSTRSYHPSHSQRPERNKEKQKILDKLEELERIQKFNE